MLVDEQADAVGRDVELARDAIDAYAEREHEFFFEDFAGMDGGKVGAWHRGF